MHVKQLPEEAELDHVVPPDVRFDWVPWVAFEADRDVSQPGLGPDGAHPVDKHECVERQPPTGIKKKDKNVLKIISFANFLVDSKARGSGFSKHCKTRTAAKNQQF